jgi:hypothetical protein
MTDRWRGNSDVFLMDPVRWPPAEASSEQLFESNTEPDEAEELSPRDRWKRKLARAWMNSNSPRYWTEPPVDPVTAITTPAAINSRKGSGAVTPEEIEAFKARERAAFAERISRQWASNLAHL